MWYVIQFYFMDLFNDDEDDDVFFCARARRFFFRASSFFLFQKITYTQTISLSLVILEKFIEYW